MLTALSEHCSSLISTSVSRHATATVLLSGGSTPRPLYELLAARDLPWFRVQAALVDERLVAPDHEASNEGMVRMAMQPAISRGLTVHGLFDGISSLDKCIEQANRNYAALPKPWTFTLLGMGSDGHTASLFPHARGLLNALSSPDFCVPITASPSAVTGPWLERISLGLKGLLSTEHLILLITGKTKWQVYRHAMTHANMLDSPVSFVLQQQKVPLDVYWCP